MNSDIIAQWLGSQQPDTARVYEGTLRDFARSVAPPETLLEAAWTARDLALSYQQKMLERGLVRATVGCRMGALRSLVSYARTLKIIDWSLDIGPVRPSCTAPGLGFQGARGQERCGP